MNPKLSIIIPVYNVEKYISKCLDSILNQTFEDFEVICINSNSPDNSMEILSEYAMEDKRIKIICQEDNGPGAARNLGLAHAKGEFISFVDGDDWIELNTLEPMFKNFSKDVDLFCFGANIIINDNYELDEKKLRIIGNLREYHIPKHDGELKLNNAIMKDITVNVWGKIFRNSIIKQNNIKFLTTLKYSEDVNFLYKYILISKKAFFINKCLYNYRQRADSSMTKITQRDIFHLAESCNAIYDVYNFLNSKKILSEKIEIFLYFLYIGFYDDYSCCNSENYNIFFETVIEIFSKMDFGTNENDFFIKKIRENNFSECVKFVKGSFCHEF